MYFPYLRGRQFELIALRELVEKSLLSDNILPIIEPVKLSSTLLKTIQAFIDADKRLGIVRNPQVGEFVSELKKEKNESLRKKLSDLVKSTTILHTFYLNKRTEEFVPNLLKNGRQISDLIAICNNTDFIPIYEKVFSSEVPMYSLIPDESTYRRRIRQNRVMIDDKFKKLKRNTDYAEIDDEPFSDDHRFYKEDGYVGFCDYSIVGDEYSETGFAPYAVAIHIVYFDEDYALRIKHFVSDTNDDINDPAKKFAEAVQKLVEWNKTKGLNTCGIKTFTEMYEKEMYPGLGTVKKLSLMHHIELMGNYLDGEL